jgi:Transposase DDE domain
VRVRPCHRDYGRAEPHPEEWLLIEWPAGDTEPSKYWLSTLPATLVDLVHMAKLRWRIERDYQDLKQELGLDPYEGRSWRGFHHHATLCIMASSCLSEVFSPLKSTSDAQRLRYPQAGGPEGIPVRPERHNPSSITSVRRRLTVALARSLPRCPCCQQQHFRRAASVSPVRNL